MKKEEKDRLREIADLEWLIRVEESEGIHTYHECSCGRGWTRRGECRLCLREQLAKLTGVIEEEK